MAEEAASSGLFGVFLLSISSLFLIPYTIHYLCSAGEDATTQPVAKSRKKDTPGERLQRLCTKGNLLLLAAWVVWFALLTYTQSSMASMKPFDPFEILGVPRDATDRDIKKAYRKLSLQYHPDKNPDPKAAQYFASFVSKAYAALTDDVSRQNYEKYGHPDGPQGMNLGVALPDWMFAKDKKAAPLMLLGLVGCGILLPLGLMTWYMLSSSKFSGPNGIMNDTFAIFMYSKQCIKESQSVVRIPETLLCAMEFITLYTPPEHQAPMQEVRKALAPCYPDLLALNNKTFWQRKAGVVKAHLLLLAHLERMGDDVPPQLQADLKYVRSKVPALLEEMVKLATLPRTASGCGWMTPSLACVEMMQCMAQAMPVATRKGGGKMGDALAPLLQLPGFDQEVVKRLRKRKINGLTDLQVLPEGQRAAELSWAGLDASAAEGVNLFLSAMPRLSVAALCEVEGEEEIMETDPVHCRVRVLLSRPSHATPGYALRGSGVRAYTPLNPVPRDESWYFFLTEPSTNGVIAWAKVNLMEAEREGMAHPEAFAPEPAAAPGGGAANGVVALAGAAAGAPAERAGQEVDLVFMAPKAATYNLSLVVMSDCWVGVDETVQLKLRVAPLTRAAAESRLAAAAAGKPAFSDTDSDADGSDGSDGSGSGSESEGDYDSEETGEEESEDGDGAKPQADRSDAEGLRALRSSVTSQGAAARGLGTVARCDGLPAVDVSAGTTPRAVVRAAYGDAAAELPWRSLCQLLQACNAGLPCTSNRPLAAALTLAVPPLPTGPSKRKTGASATFNPEPPASGEPVIVSRGGGGVTVAQAAPTCTVSVAPTGLIRAANLSNACPLYYNGCSGPSDAVPYQARLTPACMSHDMCYACSWRVVGNNTSKAARQKACDDRFKQTMLNLCDRWFGNTSAFHLTGCKATANTMYAAVALGGSSFHTEYECPGNMDAVGFPTFGLVPTFIPSFPTYAIIAPIRQGPWGFWTGWAECPAGSWLSGFRARVEADQYLGDDTALNELMFRCSDAAGGATASNLTTSTFYSYWGADYNYWGDWGDWVNCPTGQHIVGLDLAVQDAGADDTAANTLRVRCSGGGTLTQPNTLGRGYFAGRFVNCPAGMAACGARTKMEQPGVAANALTGALVSEYGGLVGLAALV
ncbi:ERDJ2A [Scenedesmus sp. PABB004]|nr:ERDJ2A [Scenedesmus sp. PABB004]